MKDIQFTQYSLTRSTISEKLYANFCLSYISSLISVVTVCMHFSGYSFVKGVFSS
jgi:hypothetical protein